MKHTSYDRRHIIHIILYKTLKLLQQINQNPQLKSRIGALLLDFPEMPNTRVDEHSFDKIVFDRKTEAYQDAIKIAQLLLLNYHPDLSRGTNHVLALMFDMNLLWEQFVYVSLRKFREKGASITAQNSRNFWKSESGKHSKIRPDIVLNKDKEDCYIIDTKWKTDIGSMPSVEDLRQMFVYLKYYRAEKVALVYPNRENAIESGTYFNYKSANAEDLSSEKCSMISIAVHEDISMWQKNIAALIHQWKLSPN